MILIVSSIANSEEFQRLWKIKKDSIEVCRDCEFRYMCVGPRIPDKKENNLWSFSTPCYYNPYNAEWEYEKGYSPTL